MPMVRVWSAELKADFSTITVRFECPFYQEFLEPDGALNRDYEAHALWDYYCMALTAQKRAKANLVYEDELSLRWDIGIARNLFQTTANKHGVRPDRMVKYWPMIERQRFRMGGSDDLPDQFKFHFWGV